MKIIFETEEVERVDEINRIKFERIIADIDENSNTDIVSIAHRFLDRNQIQIKYDGKMPELTKNGEE